MLLTQEEKLSFSLYFLVSKKRIELGKFDTAFAPIPSSVNAPASAELRLAVVIDSKFSWMNGHSEGRQKVSLPFMNIQEAAYSITDPQRLIQQKLTFNPSGNKLKVVETIKWHNETQTKNLTDITLSGPPQVYDHLSLLFKLRNIDLRQTEIVSLAVLYSNRLSPILVEYAYRESRDVRDKKTECRVYKLRPNNVELAPYKKQLKFREGTVWVTNDDRCLPVSLQIQTQEGFMFADLLKS